MAENTITKPVAEKETKAHSLVIRNENSKTTGELVAQNFEASLQSLSAEKLDDLLDSLNVAPIMVDIIRLWHNPEYILTDKCPDWMSKCDANDQLVAMTQPIPFEPGKYRKAMNQLDLEHRRVTPNRETGKVAKYVESGAQSWDNELKKMHPVMRWNSDGAKLFNARQKADVYAFVHRALELLNLEPQYASNIEDAVLEGYRTIGQRKTETALTHKMVRPKTQKVKTQRVAGVELTSEQIHKLATQALEDNPDLLRDYK